MADAEILEAARALKHAHLRADALGGEHQAHAAAAYDRLLDLVAVDEPTEIAEHRAATHQAIADAQGLSLDEVRALSARADSVSIPRAEYEALVRQAQIARSHNGGQP